jgi:hypothetical protein
MLCKAHYPSPEESMLVPITGPLEHAQRGQEQLTRREIGNISAAYVQDPEDQLMLKKV